MGRPNVGKSSLFNRLVHSQIAIVHPKAGTTRDRLQEEVRHLTHPFLVEDTPGLEYGSQKGKQKSRENSKESSNNPNNSTTWRGLEEAQASLKEAIKESKLVFWVVDVKEGITADDRDIGRWLKENFSVLQGGRRGDIDKDKGVKDKGERMLEGGDGREQEGKEKKEVFGPLRETVYKAGELARTKRKPEVHVRLLVNKADEGEDCYEHYNDIYSLGMGDPLFVSANQGTGMVSQKII